MADQDTPEVQTPAEAVKHVRPLGVAQAKQLEKLVDNDFAQVKREVQQQAQEMIEAKTEALKSEYKAERAGEYLERARLLCVEHNAKVEALIEQARVDSFRLSAPQVTTIVNDEGTQYKHSGAISISDARLQNAITESTREINSSLTSALATLERQRLAAMRRVLIASITSDAEKILNDIPSAHELMVQAAAERAERNSGAVKALDQ